MARIKFTQEIPFHEVGEIFEIVGFGGIEKRRYEVLTTDGALAEIVQVNDQNKRKKGRPMKVLMVENFKEPEFFEIPF